MADAQQLSGVSRRKAIFTGAGLVAAGAVAGAAGGVVTSRLIEEGPKDNPKVPVMVHLRNAPTGEFDVFVANSKVTIVDPGFAAKLVMAAESAAESAVEAV